MFESIINPKKAERKPWEMSIIGFIYASLAVLTTDFLFINNPVFQKHISILIVCFTVFFSIPFVYYVMKREERKDERIHNEGKLFKEHEKALSALIFLFIGYVLALSLLYVVMPIDKTNINFKIQTETYCQVNSNLPLEECVRNFESVLMQKDISGNAISGMVSLKDGMARVMTILTNNFYVFFFTLLFSFLFGAGAIFILAWNASVISAAIGIYSKGAFSGLPNGFLRYLVHGIPEILAYFVVALAGGIIGNAIINQEFNSNKFIRILQDVLDLIIVGLIILIISAFMEVFLTPIII